MNLASISELSLDDSGNYTCTAANDLDDTLIVNFEIIVEQLVDNDAQTGGASIGTRLLELEDILFSKNPSLVIFTK